MSLPALAKSFNEDLPQNIEGLIAQNPKALRQIDRLLRKSDSSEIERSSVNLQETSLLSPIVFPPKIICLGLNYFDHALESKASVPEEPIFFMKPHTTIIGPNQPILHPSFVKALDYEGELAIVIGKKPKTFLFQKQRKEFSVLR